MPSIVTKPRGKRPASWTGPRCKALFQRMSEAGWSIWVKPVSSNILSDAVRHNIESFLPMPCSIHILCAVSVVHILHCWISPFPGRNPLLINRPRSPWKPWKLVLWLFLGSWDLGLLALSRRGLCTWRRKTPELRRCCGCLSFSDKSSATRPTKNGPTGVNTFTQVLFNVICGRVSMFKSQSQRM